MTTHNLEKPVIDLNALERTLDGVALDIRMSPESVCYVCGKPGRMSVRTLLDEFKVVCVEHDRTGMSDSIMFRKAQIRDLIAELRAWRELYPGETPEQAAEHYVS